MEVPSENKLSTDLWFAYNSILQVSPYLDQMDLLEVAQVCRLWREVISLWNWETLRIENKTVDLDFLADFLAEQDTTKLTLIDCNLYTQRQGSLFEELQKIPSLQNLALSKYRPHCFDGSYDVNMNLEELSLNVLNDNSEMNLKFLENFLNLRKLDLNFHNNDDDALLRSIETLDRLKQLNYLSLSNVSNLDKLNFGSLDIMNNLSTLELGDCNKMPPSFYEGVLKHLNCLNELKLEKPSFKDFVYNDRIAIINEQSYNIGRATFLKNLTSLRRLELVYPDVHYSYEDFVPCENLKDLMIVLSDDDKEICAEMIFLRDSQITSFVIGVTSKLFDKLVKNASLDPEIVFDFFVLPYNEETRMLWRTIVEKDFDKFICQFQKVLRDELPDIEVSVIEYHGKWESCNDLCDQYRMK